MDHIIPMMVRVLVVGGHPSLSLFSPFLIFLNDACVWGFGGNFRVYGVFLKFLFHLVTKYVNGILKMKYFPIISYPNLTCN